MNYSLALVAMMALAAPLVNAQSATVCFTAADKTNCDTICPATHYSIFAKGECATVDQTGLIGTAAQTCNYVCQTTPYIWTTIFIIVCWAAAVTVLVLMLPMCCTSCSACLTVKKEKKRNKQRGGQQQMEAGTYDVAVPSKANGQMVQQQGYNPYMYWPYYGRM